MRNKGIKKYYSAVAAMVMLLVLAGCGSSKYDSAESIIGGYDNGAYYEGSYDYDMDYGYAEEDMEEIKDISSSVSLNSSSQGSVSENRKLIKEYYVDAETKEFDETLDAVQKKTAELGGYIENSEISGNSYNYKNSRYASMVIRVPADKMIEFIETVKAVGNVTNYQESVTDITLEYVDTESHIKALEIEKETLLQMLEQAGDLETLFAIQNELTDVRYELEYYESRIRTFDQQVSYGTIRLELYEVIEITEQVGEENFFEELSRRFGNNVKSMFEGSKEFVIFLISIIPFFLPLIVIAVIVLAITLPIINISKKRKTRKAVNSVKENK